MAYKFIPVSESTHNALILEKSKLVLIKGKSVTFDDLLNELLKK